MADKKPQESPSSMEATGGESGLLKKQSLGRYELRKKLGAGGMGAVYLALDTQLNRMVALKVLPPDKAENQVLVRRFKAEAQAVAQLTHDNIVRVYESGEIDGYHYIALEYVEGTDVQRLIKKRGRIPIRRATEIITQVAQALDHANQAGIVHRDVKPANLLITQAGIVKLTDLGLARVMDENEETSLTRAGTTVGTVDYMAPEQARSSKAADIRSDIYSLGCTWYHMLTGTPPYPEGSVTNKLQAHAVSRIPDPREINEAVPESVVGVLQRMMAKKPIDRYQTTEELLQDLQAVKTSKKEISADDLAALAGGDEEIVPSARVSRVQLADDDDDAVEASAGRGGKARTTRENSGEPASQNTPGATLPPREKKSLSETDIAEKKQINTELLVYIGLALGLLLLIGGAGYVLSGVGSAIDRSDDSQVNLLEHAEQNQSEREAVHQPGSGDAQQAGEQTRIKQQPATMEEAQSQGSVPPTGTVQIAVNGKEDALPVIRLVNRNQPVDETSAHTFADALAKTKAKDLIIELQTSGLYRWDQPVIVDGRSLTIRKSAESTGTVLIDSAGPLSSGLITIRKGRLTLDGLHFGLLGYDLPGTAELKLLRILDADLTVRNCSFTFEESRKAPVTLCEISQNGNNSCDCRWEQTLVRGRGWKPFDISAGKLKLLLDRCLVFIDTQPVITLNHAPGQSGERFSDDPADREIAISESGIVNVGTMFVVSNTGRDLNVPPTQFRLHESWFATTTATGEQPFVSIQNWPENVLSTAGSAKLSLVNWICEDSQITGWNQRLQGTTNRTNMSYRAESDQQWQEFWGHAGLGGEWQKTAATPLNPEQLELASVGTFHSLGLSSVVSQQAERTAGWEKIQQPALSEATWRAAVVRESHRSPQPRELFTSAVPRLKVDLNRQDLGEFLSAPEVPGTAVIEARGFGLRNCSPLLVQNKHLKIEFVSEKGRPPLTLRPVPRRGDATGKPFPWIVVEDGSLEMDSGIFRLEQVAKNPLPSAWIEARQAQLELVKCYVTGPEQPDAKLPALIKVTGIEGTGAQQVLRMDQCFLHYGGTLVDIDLRAQQLMIQNSVLVSQSHLLLLRHAGGEKSQRGLFELVQNTLSGRSGAIHFEVAAPGASGKPWVDGVVNLCAFVPAVPSAAKSPPVQTVLSAGFPFQELPQRVWWWSHGNGFSPEISQTYNKRPLQEFWPEFWGAGHVKDPMFGADGVLLEKAPQKTKDIRPSEFTLFSQSKAGQSGQGSSRMGADCASLDLSDYEAEQKPDGPGKPNAKPENKPTAPRF